MACICILNLSSYSCKASLTILNVCILAPVACKLAFFCRKARSGTCTTFFSNVMGGGQYGSFSRVAIEVELAFLAAC